MGKNILDVPLPPWHDAPTRLISWWDIEIFSAEHFYKIAKLLNAIETNHLHRSLKDSDSIAGDEEEIALAGDLAKIRRACSSIGLHISADRIKDFRAELLDQGYNLASHHVSATLTEISNLIAREMKRSLFLYILTERAKFYQSPLQGWEPSVERFGGKILNDIEETSRCLACDRYAAAVFHVMRVAEFGALAVGELIEIKDPKPSWHGVMAELRRITQETKYPNLKPIEQQHFKFLEQLFPLMLAMQNAWRHKISHAANRLVLDNAEILPYVAEDIITATRAFMRRLAADLPP